MHDPLSIYRAAELLEIAAARLTGALLLLVVCHILLIWWLISAIKRNRS
jgi:hypothetical protein